MLRENNGFAGKSSHNRSLPRDAKFGIARRLKHAFRSRWNCRPMQNPMRRQRRHSAQTLPDRGPARGSRPASSTMRAIAVAKNRPPLRPWLELPADRPTAIASSGLLLQPGVERGRAARSQRARPGERRTGGIEIGHAGRSRRRAGAAASAREIESDAAPGARTRAPSDHGESDGPCWRRFKRRAATCEIAIGGASESAAGIGSSRRTKERAPGGRKKAPIGGRPSVHLRSAWTCRSLAGPFRFIGMRRSAIQTRNRPYAGSRQAARA